MVTGVSRDLGAQFARRIADDPSVDKVVGVDLRPPREDLLGVTFVRADIRKPVMAKALAVEDVDTVVHLSVAALPAHGHARSSLKESNVIGTMQLLAACQKAPSMRKLVVKSTTAVYGSTPRDPALFTEDVGPRSLPRSGYAKDAVEVEGYVRGFGRRRPDVTLSVLRFTNFIGPTIETPLTRYLTLPVVPTVFGFDPRVQLCHEDDAIEVLRRVIEADHPGIFNAGGAGILLLSQALRRLGRLTVPIPSPAVSFVARAFRSAKLVDFSPEQMRYLEHGRVADVSRLQESLGWAPRPTAQAFDAFAAVQPGSQRVESAASAAEQRLYDLFSRQGSATRSDPGVPVA